MPNGGVFILALLIQVVAQTFGGVWGAAAGGVLIGLAARGKGPFRTGFLAAAVAAALLLAVTSARGAPVWHWAEMMGANFSLPGWGFVALVLLLPALQAGGLAGGIGGLAAAMRREPR